MEIATKKKVLFVIDTLELGGAEKSLLENVTRFKQIIPVICHLYSGHTLKAHFEERGIKVYSANIKKKYGFRQAYRELKTIAHIERPALIVAYLTRSEIVSRITGKLNNIPVVGTFISDLYSPVYNQNLSYTSQKAVSFFKLINRITSRFCAGFIANSESIRTSNAMQLGIPLQKIQVVNRGRDSKVFRFAPPTLFVGKPIRFLNIGRLVSIKGQHELVTGFKTFLNSYPDATLHIVGEGPCREELAGLIRDNLLDKNVFLLGARNDVPQIINRYDCFVFPSLSEGFSGSVVEAMFAGLPVLASDIPANLEAIRHLETGYIFQRGSAGAITEALSWFMKNMEAAGAFAIQANAHAKHKFELENIAGEFELYLQTIIARNN